ncbi:MAG TPA: YbaK/EbsC family protein [Candidatus Bathyarchaeia archaeon]|nr:YbaK/EbsC family protein [Candidatus Bathyarchaeia archaeon]
MGIQQLELLKELLDKHGISYQISQHEPVYTSEQAAKVRGAELRTGVKALVLRKKEGDLILGLVAADRRIDLRKLAKITGTRSLAFANKEEVLNKTGCEVGSVHPFGNLYALPTYADESVLGCDTVNFNAGMHTVSIQMKVKDLIEIVAPTIASFSL